MANTRLVNSASNVHGSVSNFGYIATGGSITGSQSTEATAQTIFRSAGTFSNLFVQVTARTGSTVIVTRKGTVSQNLTVTVTGTGIIEDTTDTDTVTAADKWNYNFSNLASTFTVLALTFTATTNTVSRLTSTVPSTTNVSFNTANLQGFNAPAGRLGKLTVEADAQTRVRKAGTLTNMFVHIGLNNGTTGSVVTSRGGSGTMTITANSGTTGFVEDTTNTVTISVGDDINTLVTAGATLPNTTISKIGLDYTSTTQDGLLESADTGSATLARNTTFFMALGGADTNSTTETDWQLTARDTYTLSNFTANVTVNSIASTSTFFVRNNAGNGNETFTFASTETGVKSDTTNTDVLAATDNVNYSVATGTGSGVQTLTMRFIEVWTNLTPVVPVTGFAVDFSLGPPLYGQLMSFGTQPPLYTM